MFAYVVSSELSKKEFFSAKAALVPQVIIRKGAK